MNVPVLNYLFHKCHLEVTKQSRQSRYFLLGALMPFSSSYRGKQCGNEESITGDLGSVVCGAPFIWYTDTYFVIQKKSPAKNFLPSQWCSHDRGMLHWWYKKESIPWVYVFQKVIYFTWCDINFSLFPIVSRLVYPWPHWVFPACGWNNHGEYPQHVLACTDDVSVKNMSTHARMTSEVWNSLLLYYCQYIYPDATRT